MTPDGLQVQRPDVDMVAASAAVVQALLDRGAGKSPEDLVRYVYYEAIDDAANFARDLAPHNPLQASTLRAVETELRHWLCLR